MAEKRRVGRPSKGPREYMGFAIRPELKSKVLAEADRRGLSITDFACLALAHELGEDYAIYEPEIRQRRLDLTG